MNKGEMGFCARKEGFLEAGALKERRDPAQDSQCQKTLTFRAETSRTHSRISSLPFCGRAPNLLPTQNGSARALSLSPSWGTVPAGREALPGLSC